MRSSTAETPTPDRAIPLESVRRTLQLFYQALSGRYALLASYEDIPSHRQLDTGRTVILPVCERHVWYRVAVAHRAMHEELRTMRFRNARAGRVFPSLRPGLQIPPRRRRETDLQLIFHAFEDQQTALDCFVLLEDLRVDATVVRRYPGLRADFRAVQDEELQRRPPLMTVPARAALLEVLARVSLGQRGRLEVPRSILAEARELVGIATLVTVPEATVEDVMEVTIRAYEILRLSRPLPTVMIPGVPPLIDVVPRDPQSGPPSIGLSTRSATETSSAGASQIRSSRCT